MWARLVRQSQELCTAHVHALVCRHVRTYVCVYVCMYVCMKDDTLPVQCQFLPNEQPPMYVCMYVCMYV